MKLFKLRLTTLKSKLYAIVFASFVVRVVGFFILPNKGSLIPPDENGYSVISAAASTGKSVKVLLGGDELFLASRTLVLPASVLIRFGVDQVSAVRIVSSFYGILSVCLVALLLFKIVNKHSMVNKMALQSKNLILLPFGIFAFLPSHLFWSILGLREAAMEFWVIATFTILFFVFETKLKNTTFLFLGIILSLVCVFSSRPQVGWVLGLSLLLYLTLRIKERAAQLLIPATLVGVFLGYAVTSPYFVEVTSTFIAIPSAPTTQLDISKAGKLCQSDKQELVFNTVKFRCTIKIERKSSIGLKNPGSVLVNQADAITYKHEVNKIDANSAIKTLECPNTGDSRLDNYFCIAYRAPYMIFTFLFRPLLGSDVTSTASLFAASENILWLAIFVYITAMYFRNKKLIFLDSQLPSLMFVTIYIVAAGSYEGNMGTAFRHKSLILWVVILLLASTIMATQQRKAQREGFSGTSQE